jgi:hypothetical protein
MAVKSINLKDLVSGEYKGYSNELWRIASSLSYNNCVKILRKSGDMREYTTRGLRAV